SCSGRFIAPRLEPSSLPANRATSLNGWATIRRVLPPVVLDPTGRAGFTESLPEGLERGRVADVAADRPFERCVVVGEQHDLVAGAADRDVQLARVQEVPGLPGVGHDDHAIDRRALGG